MSKAALKNPDRNRERKYIEIEMPPEIAAVLEPGTRAFVNGSCRILLSQQKEGWHMSISRSDRLPTWEQVRDARYDLIPPDLTMAMILPPPEYYVNVHEFCFQLYEIPAEYINDRQDRL